MTEYERKYVVLLGRPLRQSFGPRMQNRAYEAMGVNFHYTLCETGKEHLGEIVTGLRYMPNFAGFAVTKPDKVEVLQYLDALDPLCEKIGACNTVVKDGERLVGYNTDAEGFKMSVCSHVEKVEKVFCIGCGGAGRAITFVLAELGCKKIILLSKNGVSAKALAEDINKYYPDLAEVGEIERIPDCDMIVNASGVGMGESLGTSPIPKKLLRKGQFCFDACYNPARTQFLLDAEAQGCQIMNGMDMSLYQGVRQIELWTGKPAPMEVMREELENNSEFGMRNKI